AEIIERTGWEVEVKRCADMTSLFGELDSKRIDVAANCAAITASRLEAHIASDPIYADAQVVVVQPDSSYQTFEDLRGQVMGCTAGQAAQNTVEKMAPDYDWDIRPYDNTGALFQDLDLGRIPSLAHTVSTVEKYQREQGLKLRMLDEKLFGNNVGWWFRMDDESKALRDDLNKVLAEMQADGTISKITEKYFYEDMTKLISDEWLTSTN
ncbi:MAG: transporter substrate-binding domain-containing protein, partial [Firmicutes bacterium]|nr:transporter substrate-binding domain-containing protein [Bacillota bacterium]